VRVTGPAASGVTGSEETMVRSAWVLLLVGCAVESPFEWSEIGFSGDDAACTFSYGDDTGELYAVECEGATCTCFDHGEPGDLFEDPDYCARIGDTWDGTQRKQRKLSIELAELCGF
jgi:hypothetical protein